MIKTKKTKTETKKKDKKDCLLVFIKNPIKGKVKTRLAASVGDEEALRIYLRLLAHTRETTSLFKGTKIVCYSHFIPDVDEWQSAGFEAYLQKGEDLGDRMNRAFAHAFQNHSRVAGIGSDCPGIHIDIIHQTFLSLDNRNVTIGPSLDGGYYLLSMDEHYPNLFQDITWSSSAVLEQTLEKTTALGLQHQLLIPLSDIDYLEDWEKYGLED